MPNTITFLQRYQRIITSLVIGLVSGILCIWFNQDLDNTLVDLGWSFNAAQDLITGRDPYRHTVSANLVPYPLTAAIIVMLWSFFPHPFGLFLLFGSASGLLAYGLLREGQYWRLLLFCSPAFLMAVKSMQWSPFFVLVLLYPIFSPVLLAKPSLAIPVALSIRWNFKQIIISSIIILLALVFMPSWPWRWISQIGEYGGFVPLFTILGPIFLISLLFWRNENARLFFLLTITPQHRLFYDQLLLWMIPKSFYQMMFLNATSWIAFLYVRITYVTLWASLPWLLILVYLPSLLIVLWQQELVQKIINKRRGKII